MVEQRMGGGREFEASVAAVEQRRLKASLEIGHPLADGRGCDMLAISRLGDAELLADRDEKLKCEQIEAHGPSPHPLASRLARRRNDKSVAWRPALLMAPVEVDRASQFATPAFPMKSFSEPGNRTYDPVPNQLSTFKGFLPVPRRASRERGLKR